MTRLIDVLALTAAIGAGLVAGVMFAFSSFVMPALGRMPAERAIEAMQSINREAVTPLFMTALFGTMGTSLATAGLSLSDLDRPDARWRLAGSGLYLLTIAITAAFHIPRNDRLATITLPIADAAGRWQAYAGPWTIGNHVRTLTAVAAAGCFIVAIRGGWGP